MAKGKKAQHWQSAAGPPKPDMRGPEFANKNYYKNSDQQSLPDVDEPPVYRDPGNSSLFMPGRNKPDQRRMGTKGWPDGPSRYKDSNVNTHGQWANGEFERSYPRSDPKNDAWYRKHAYQPHDGRWVTKTRDDVYPKAPSMERRASEAIANHHNNASSQEPAKGRRGEPAKGRRGEPAKGRKGSSSIGNIF